LSRAKAIAQNRSVALSIDLKNRVINSSPPITIPATLKIDLLTSQGENQTDHLSFNFYPDGAASGGKIILTLEGSTREIDINWLTSAIVQGSELAP
jgi:general secretion pathway protein H